MQDCRLSEISGKDFVNPQEMKKLILLVSALLLLSFGACQKQTPETFPAVRYLYGGHQDNNGFQMWIWLFEDETVPARVHSGMCRYIDDNYVDTDVEFLTCHYTQDGFTLSDQETGKVLYTATNVPSENYVNAEMDGAPSYHVHVTWTHSPGAAWDALAEKKGWQREITLSFQMNEGDDIIGY